MIPIFGRSQRERHAVRSLQHASPPSRVYPLYIADNSHFHSANHARQWLQRYRSNKSYSVTSNTMRDSASSNIAIRLYWTESDSPPRSEHATNEA
jgi:hypothetical protein